MEVCPPMIQITHDELNVDDVEARVRHPARARLSSSSARRATTPLGARCLALEYEAYQPIADQQLEQVAAEMRERWDLTGVAIAHRLGRLEIGEASLVVAVSSAHRKEAFEACHFSVDRIKQIVPIWKKEFFEGGEVWIGSQADFDPIGIRP